jgi:hypothetical protein
VHSVLASASIQMTSDTIIRVNSQLRRCLPRSMGRACNPGAVSQCDRPLALKAMTCANDSASPMVLLPERPEELIAVVTPTLATVATSPLADPTVDAVAS